MFERLKRWLNEGFICTGCGKTVHLFTFGYGTTVCPDCYEGETPIVNFDEEYWLNRMLIKLQRRGN